MIKQISTDSKTDWISLSVQYLLLFFSSSLVNINAFECLSHQHQCGEFFFVTHTHACADKRKANEAECNRTLFIVSFSVVCLDTFEKVCLHSSFVWIIKRERDCASSIDHLISFRSHKKCSFSFLSLPRLTIESVFRFDMYINNVTIIE